MFDATPTRTPQITIAFTVGDLRGNAEPLGTFTSREGAELYGRALGIPRDAIHVEAVTLGYPVLAPNALGPGSAATLAARKGLEAFAALEQRAALGAEVELARAERDQAAATAERLEKHLAAARTERDELRGDRDELTGLRGDHETLCEAAEALLSELRIFDPDADKMPTRASLVERLREGVGTVAGLVTEVDELLRATEEHGKSTHADAISHAVEYLGVLVSEREAAKGKLTTQARETLVSLGVELVTDEVVSRVTGIAPKAAPAKATRTRKAAP